MTSHSNHNIDLSIVIPVYNEEKNLEILISELQEAVNGSDQTYEVIFVNDGSLDSSGEIIRSLARQYSEVKGIHLKENYGQTAAFDAGFKRARGNIIVTMDSDLQNDPKDILLLIAHLNDCDAVIGWRERRRDHIVKRVSSRIANWLRNKLSGDSIIDTGCSLKAFNSQCINKISLYRGMHRFMPTLLRMEGYRVLEVKVSHRPRLHGKTKYGIKNRILVGFEDLLAVRWMKKRKLNYEIEEYDD
jgi:glycosyltransferase involved in cell wall biosynthesis